MLANAGFALMYLVGSPPRFFEIMIFGAVGLVVRKRSYIVQLAAFLALMAFSLLSFIAGLFNLGMASLTHSIMFFAELDVSQSYEYVAGSIFIGGLIVIAMLALRRPTSFEDQRMTLLAAGATLSLALVDLYMGYGMRGHYNRVAAAGAPFESAIENSKIVPASGAIERNLLVIMVESMGVPVGNEEMDTLLFRQFANPNVQSRFEVSKGTTTYYSSTTSGEIRELCGRWGEYHDLRETTDSGCLPARLAAQGVQTTAYHSFDGKFFDRNLWYPNIGFEDAHFRESLAEGGAERCGGVFPGVCDRDVPAQIAARLKETAEPQFVYWLSVNSHLPVPLESNLDVENCERISPQLARDYPMICRQFAIWDAMDEALVKEILASDFPPTDILIVGDHMPPYFDRHNRQQFAPDRVPWLMLKWRG
ncbi:hypothetical protein CD351_06845 [Erythrobacter sp. KY5]|nr:hypothetical protein CD351_06845 [Erythrobacter sp. KY5]